jgi:multidrug efflux system outer membrane protein
MAAPVKGRTFVASLALVGACASVGPDYKRPEASVPATFENTGPWKVAEPGDLLARGDWWTLFNDPVLDELERAAKQQSPTLAAYAARVDQALAAAGIANSFRYPEVGVGATIGRYQASKDRPDQPSKKPVNTEYQSGVYRVPVVVSYELDIWGRVRRLSESARARADASAAEYQTGALTLESEIAITYFRLRQADEEKRIFARNIELQQHARDLVAKRKAGGLASELDLARADTELELTVAGLEEVKRRREDLRLVLAYLVGRLPESFPMEEAAFGAMPPAIPVGLPATLMERRPDIAEAEKALMARNAEIGVAKAAYFPAIRLTGAIGFESSELSNLTDGTSVIWSLGASVFQPIFNAGRTGFDVDRAKAAYDEGVANYRNRLLRAFREVESALSALRTLDDQSAHQVAARQGADRAVHLAELRYRAGLVTVVEVIDAQRTALRADREALAVKGAQLVSTVSLVKALGGTWQPPSADRTAALAKP